MDTVLFQRGRTTACSAQAGIGSIKTQPGVTRLGELKLMGRLDHVDC